VAGLGRPFGRGSMTNHWNDIDNASMVFVFGANPAENHPACMAHVNAARFGNGKNAKLIVVDPRLTRTARQVDTSRGDRFVRIRPGTNVAFTNGLLNYILNQTTLASGSQYNSGAITQMMARFNGTAANSTAARGFADNRGNTSNVLAWSKDTDAKFVLNAAGTDYTYGQRLELGANVVSLEGATRQTVCTSSDATPIFRMWYVPSAGGTYLKYSLGDATGDAWAAGVDTNVPIGHDAPFVWREGTNYYMLNNDGGNNIELWGTTEAAPTVWTSLSATVLAPADVSASLVKLDAPMVMKDATFYYLFVQGKDGAGTRRIYGMRTPIANTPAATWVAGIFTTMSGSALLDVGASLKWDDAQVMHPFVRKNSASAAWPLWEMWYSGYSVADPTNKIGYATSTDGVAWTRQAYSATQDYWFRGPEAVGSSAAKPVIVDVGTGCWMYFESQTARVRRYRPAWFNNFPILASTVTGTGTVWEALKQHLIPYDAAAVAGICGCTTDDIEFVAKALIDNSRWNSSDVVAGFATPQALTYKATTILYAMGQTQHTNGSQNIKDLAIIQNILGNMGRAGGGINALRGIHNVQGSTDMGLLFDSIPAYSGNPGVDEHYAHYLNALFGNRLESTGGTVAKAYLTATNLGIQQRGFMNMTAEWFGNGLASTANIEKLYDLWPKGNGIQHITTFRRMAMNDTDLYAYLKVGATNSEVTYTAVAVGDLGNGVSITHLGGISQTLGVSIDVDNPRYIKVQLGTDGTGAVTSTATAVATAVNGFGAAAALVGAAAGGTGLGVAVTKAQTYLANGNTRIHASVVWGQNPAVTEPNQSAVRAGLRHLDLLVVVDMFETETAACDREAGKPTYLIPACSHAEEAGSVTNSGRWLQWRERATAPKGNSKADMELLLRFAYALDQADAFSHILHYWSDAAHLNGAIVPAVSGHVYTELFGKYGWTPGDPAFELKTATTEMWPARNYLGTDPTYAPVIAPVSKSVKGSEVICEEIYKEMCRPLNYLADDTRTDTTGGTMWIYSGSGTGGTAPFPDATGQAGYNGSTTMRNLMPAVTTNVAGATKTWQCKNRAKNRNNVVTGSIGDAGEFTDRNPLNYPRWGWAWLLNRRVFYNNSEVYGDQADNFVSPGLVSCMFTMNVSSNALADWALAYRKYKTMADAPSTTTGPHFVSAGKTFMGRFPGHTEPYESPREADLVPLWGHNMSGTNRLITAGDAVGTIATYPFVLTSIRCVEHFQGGPITRNNEWNVEAEPVPWIEINSYDALHATPAINDGDWVNVETLRSDSLTDQSDLTPGRTGWPRGFKARVGVGLDANQRVARGVVAIPWHWGDKGLSKGSRANDLCIDAWDANTMIPEYKACLCKITKI
jgi:anaerobic selenocysteine-containing dehydrogenase